MLIELRRASLRSRAMGEVIYGAFETGRDASDKVRSPKQRTLLNAVWLWELKGWTYQLPATNLPGRWEKEISGSIVWAYKLEQRGRYGKYTFERRSDAHKSRWSDKCSVGRYGDNQLCPRAD